MISAGIFREYDVRGVFGKDLTLEAAELIGKGFGAYSKEKGVKRLRSAGMCGFHLTPCTTA